MCAGRETASQTKGIDQLREVAWELLTKGRAGELEKESFEDIREADEEDDNQNEDDTAFPNKNKHPQFDRKIKVVGNDSFLKQIFS